MEQRIDGYLTQVDDPTPLTEPLTVWGPGKPTDELGGGKTGLEGVTTPSTGFSEVASGDAVIDPGKWSYIFGGAKGTKNAAHNGPRTAENLQMMTQLGIYDTAEGRQLLQSHFDKVVSDPANIVNEWTNNYGAFQSRESLLAGPGGFLKLITSWQVMPNGAYRFTTIIPIGGK